jgi:hypothetical protein
MYINRKDGTLVEVINPENGEWKGYYIIKHPNGTRIIDNVEDFQEKYGEAMIRPNRPFTKPHIKGADCTLYGCVPYVPEKPTNPQSPYLLTPEEICKKYCPHNSKYCDHPVDKLNCGIVECYLDIFNDFLQKLADKVYVKKWSKHDDCWTYHLLSEVLGGEE